jgi:hypothetical protein
MLLQVDSLYGKYLACSDMRTFTVFIDQMAPVRGLNMMRDCNHKCTSGSNIHILTRCVENLNQKMHTQDIVV